MFAQVFFHFYSIKACFLVKKITFPFEYTQTSKALHQPLSNNPPVGAMRKQILKILPHISCNIQKFRFND